jgi:hypothetical protein
LIGYEDQDNYEVYIENFDKRINRIESWNTEESKSHDIILAEMYAHAGLANVMYGDYVLGFRKLLKPNKLSKRNLKNYPDFWPNYKLCGALNISFDQMPSVLKFVTSLFGLKGDSGIRLKQLNTYMAMIQGYPGLKSEALVYKVFTMKMKKDEEGAYQMLKKETTNVIPPTLVKYLQANVMYLTARNEEALSLLHSFPEDFIEIPFYHIDYLKGESKMNKLDEDANVYMIRFLEGSKFKNYKREMYNMFSYYFFIHNDHDQYNFYKSMIDQCVKATSDRDREANVESKRPYKPHPELLKARFLVKGGYMDRAKEILNNIVVNSLSVPGYRTEYYLLRARIFANENNYSSSKHYCNMAISAGKEQEEHYASEAAFLAGDIALETGNKTMSRAYYEMTFRLNRKKDIYTENIQKKAKYKLKNLESNT